MSASRGLDALLLRQVNASARLRLVRGSLGVVGAVAAAALPRSDFLADHRDDLRALGHATPGLPPGVYGRVKGVAVAANIAVAMSGSSRLALVASTATACASHESASVYRRIWTYDTHVPALLLLASVPVPDEGVARTRRAAVVLTLMQSLVACVYGQAALAKVRNGRGSWLRTGGTLRGSVAIMGTPAARRLMDFPAVFPILGAGAVLLEAAIPVAALSGRRGQRLAGIGGLAFHASTAASLRIPFWHLAAVLPPLFIWGNGATENTPEGQPGRSVTDGNQRRTIIDSIGAIVRNGVHHGR